YLNGNGNGKAPASILGRKNQIAELQTGLSRLHEKVSATSLRKGTLHSEQTELQASLQQAQTELRAQEVAIATREGEFTALQNSDRLLHQKIDTVVYEIQSLAAQEQEGLQKRAELGSRAQELETREREAQDQVAGLTSGLEGLRQQRDTANSGLTESRVALATEEQMKASFQQQHNALELRIRELSHVIEQRRGELSTFVARREQAQREIQESRLEIDRLSHDREQVNAQTGELVGQKQAQEGEIGGREEALREERRRLSEFQQQRGTIEVELAQKNMATKKLRERIQHK